MKALDVPETVLARMAEHARATYPEECCGLLIARPEEATEAEARTVIDALPLPNEFDGERRRRFLVRPEQLRAVEQRLDRRIGAVAGFYHSHPDHAARPSQLDEENAWPWYSYVVIGLTATRVRAVRGFELDPRTEEFREVPLRAVTAHPRRPTMT